MIAITIIIIALMIAAASLLSATETAITSTSPARIHKLKFAGFHKTDRVLDILKTKEKVISTLLIGNSIINTVCTTIATSLFIELLGDDYGTIVASAVMSFLIIVFAEVIPKAIAVPNAERIALKMSGIISFSLRILHPVNSMLAWITKIFCLIMRINLNQEISAVDEVRGLLEHHHQEGNVFKSDRDMLGSILDIKDITIGEIMIHKSNILSIQVDLPLQEIIAQAMQSHHSKIPLWKDNKENIVGVLPTKNLFTLLYANNNDLSNLDLQELILKPWFVPDNATVSQQLHLFKERREYFAFVVNEYGDLKGIITLQDILDEIIGKTDDGPVSQEEGIIQKSSSEYIIDGATTIRDLNRKFNWTFSDEHASTIAGLILHETKRIPLQGEKIIINDMQFIVKKKQLNRIKTIHLIIPKVN